MRQASRVLNVANFSVSGALDTSGSVLPRVMFNVPKLGGWLSEVASCGVSEMELLDSGSDFAWPTPLLAMSKSQVRGWAPLAVNDVMVSSLPVLFVEFVTEKTITFECVLPSNSIPETSVHLFFSEDLKHFRELPDRRISFSGRGIVALVVWHDNLFACNRYESPVHMMTTVQWEKVRETTFEFEQHLPMVPSDKRILLNMEIVPAFALTRVLKTGEILTMGYCELNQRDSFWTSFVHLVLYKDAEKKMIQESCDGQLESGKMPTTLLPLMERKWDIDITAYFVLRVARFLHYYGEKDVVLPWFDCARKAISYLASLRDDKNVPFARDFWADWKDIKGLNDRLYGPHFVLLTKAAVKEFNWMATELEQPTVDVEVNVEPLWNGRYYQDVMRDGSSDGRFHQDQMIGEMWNVCGEGRFTTMLEKAEELGNSFGLPETLPFYPDEFGYAQGEYHNGGIWPWLSFADAAARIASGHRDSGEKLLYLMAETDITTFGDLCSNEYCHGVNGKGGGHYIQGWNACAILPFSLISPEPRNSLSKYTEDLRR